MQAVHALLASRHSIFSPSSFSSSPSLLGRPRPTACAPSRIHRLAANGRVAELCPGLASRQCGHIFLSAHVPSPGVCPAAPEASPLPPGALFLLALPSCSAQGSTTPDVCSTQVSTLSSGCTGLHQVTVCSLVFTRVTGPKGSETAK